MKLDIRDLQSLIELSAKDDDEQIMAELRQALRGPHLNDGLREWLQDTPVRRILALLMAVASLPRHNPGPFGLVPIRYKVTCRVVTSKWARFYTREYESPIPLVQGMKIYGLRHSNADESEDTITDVWVESNGQPVVHFGIHDYKQTFPYHPDEDCNEHVKQEQEMVAEQYQEWQVVPGW